MRPVVGCWFFLFCFFLASAPVDSRSAAQAASARKAAKAALGRGIFLDLLRRRGQSRLGLLAPAAAPTASRPDPKRSREIGSGTGLLGIVGVGFVVGGTSSSPVQMPLTQMSG